MSLAARVPGKMFTLNYRRSTDVISSKLESLTHSTGYWPKKRKPWRTRTQTEFDSLIQHGWTIREKYYGQLSCELVDGKIMVAWRISKAIFNTQHNLNIVHLPDPKLSLIAAHDMDKTIAHWGKYKIYLWNAISYLRYDNGIITKYILTLT